MIGRMRQLLRHISMIYTARKEALMAKSGIAKLFRNGRSQAVRLPQEFRFEGDRVRIRRVAHGVLLEPLISDPKKWLEALDRFSAGPIMPKRRKPPVAPRREIFE